MLLLILIWGSALCLIVYLNCGFWKIMPDREDNEWKESKARNIAPCIEPTPIPRSDIRAYYRDWFIAIVILLVIAYGIYWIVNN